MENSHKKEKRQCKEERYNSRYTFHKVSKLNSINIYLEQQFLRKILSKLIKLRRFIFRTKNFLLTLENVLQVYL